MNPFTKALNYFSGTSVVNNATNPNSAYSKARAKGPLTGSLKRVPSAPGPINKAGLKMGSMENNGK